MADSRRIERIHEILQDHIDGTAPLLHFETPFQLLVAVILSAQTTDAQVNGVTGELFERYGTPAALCAADSGDVERIVRSTGFYRAKAANIRQTACSLLREFEGEVPCDMESLTGLPGVGRKSASVVLGALFDQPVIIVDTHFKRVTTRLDLTREESPERIERDLRTRVPESIQYEFSMLINRHGRIWCRARKPLCGACPIESLCEYHGKCGLGLQ